MRIEDILSEKQLIDYSKAYPVEEGGLAQLFPTRKVTDFEFDWIKGAYNKSVMAEMYAYDTPTELGQREGYERGSGDMYLIKEKMKLDEREIIRLHNPRSDAEAQMAIRRIYNDVDEIRQRIENRIEWMRYQVLQTGKLDYLSNGIKTAIDFGIPNNHKGTLANWSNPTTDVLEDIYNITDSMYRETGFKPEHILMSTKWLHTLLKNQTIRSALLGTESAKFITPPELNSALSQMGLPTISIDEKRMATQKVVYDKKGQGKLVKTFEKMLDEDTILFLPSGPMGETIRGIVPELYLHNYASATERAGDIVITHYEDVDPVAHYVKGSATAMVTFPYAEQIYIGKAE